MILPDKTTVAAQLVSCNGRASELLQEWQKYGSEFVSDVDISSLSEQREKLEGKLVELEKEINQQSTQLKLHRIRLLIARLLCVHSLESTPASILIATIPCAGIAIILAVLKLPLLFTFITIIVCFVLSSCLIAKQLNPVDTLSPHNAASELVYSIRQKQEDLIRSRLDYNNVKHLLERKKRLFYLRQEYEKQSCEIKRLGGILADRRYQLEKYDWRSLRGIPFENFMAEVFRELGYSVQMTKASGDQGVDLIVTGKGNRIAIQTKGYSDSVGNGAIQEVYAGMTYYQCDSCVAVTNSNFTAPAWELAKRVGCTLIDGEAIPKLIHGLIM